MKIDRKILAVFLLLLVLVIGVISCQNKDKNTPPPSNETPIPESAQRSKEAPRPPSSSFSAIGDCIIDMAGEIDEYTVGSLTKIYNTEIPHHICKDAKYPITTLRILNSKGGNVEEAIKAGEFIRQNRIKTFIKDSCASACVIMYLGGIDRGGIGKVGLHRPYSTKMSTTETEAKANYEQINGLIRQYLTRMNIPERLLDLMNSFPPDGIKWYDSTNREDNEQLKELYIFGDDPVDADQLASSQAKSLGISKQEYYLRSQRSRAVCDVYWDMEESQVPAGYSKFYFLNQCIQDVMHGRR